MTVKKLKPFMVLKVAESGEVEPKIEAARWGVGIKVAEQACEELCKEGKLKRGRKVTAFQMKPLREITYHIYEEP